MSDDVLSKRLSLNIGSIAESAEEVSQKYEKVFQQYSRLKAQHAVLKKAIIKEQTISVSLQGTVKEKEKELRKLQEQLDLLSFHNDRLTKRIQAVKEFSQKTSHFSLLGGSAKKELEKSTQVLEEVNTRLGNTICHNESLHKELVERKAEFKENINDLLSQISSLESQLQKLEAYRPVVTSPEIYTNSENYELEIDILRGILLANSKGITENILRDTDLSCKLLEGQEEISLKFDDNIASRDSCALPSPAIIERLKTSYKTWREELEHAHFELEAKREEVKEFLEKKKQGNMDPFEIQTKQLYDNHEEELKQLNDKHIKKNMYINANYENKLKEHIQCIENNTNRIRVLEDLSNKLKTENTQLKQCIEQVSTKVDQQTQTTIIAEEEDTPKNERNIYPKKDSVCTGADVAKISAEEDGLAKKLEEAEEEPEEDIFGKEEIMSMMKVYYDQQIKDITAKLQVTDKRTWKYAETYRVFKKKLDKEERNRQSKLQEIERLNKEVNDIQDLLTSTETNHQKQIETMTEYIASMQENNGNLT